MNFMAGGNPEPLLAAITEDAVIKAIIPDGTPISGEFRGRDGFLRYLTALHEVMEILAVETTDITASADHVVMLGSEKARGAAHRQDARLRGRHGCSPSRAARSPGWWRWRT